MKIKLAFTAITIISLLSGCTMLGPDYKEPDIDMEKDWLNYEDDQQIATPPVDVKWWDHAFHDETLNTLVEMALSENLTLRSAGLRVLQARQKLAIAVGSQYPQSQSLNGSAQSGTVSPSSRSSQQYGTSFNLSWEVDVWGRFQRQIESASANLDVSIAEYDGVMISLVSEVAQNYLLIRETELRLTLFRDNLKLQQESLRITDAKYKAGEVSALDSEQAKTLLYNTKASISSLEPVLQQLKNSLAILLGKPPYDMSDLLANNQGIPTVNKNVSLGMPQNLLRRRPDIRTSERQLATQSAQIGFAITELYPHFSIGGIIGTNSGSSGSDLFKDENSNWNTFVSFNWNIFNYGRLKGNVKLQDALFQQRLEDYHQTVLEAQGEVENAIVAFLASNKQVEDYTQAVTASLNAMTLSQIQYRDGLVNFNTVISTQQTLTQQQDILVQTQGNTATDLVNVYKSLGGGWEIRDNRDPVDFLPQVTKDEMIKRTEQWQDTFQ